MVNDSKDDADERPDTTGKFHAMQEATSHGRPLAASAVTAPRPRQTDGSSGSHRTVTTVPLVDSEIAGYVQSFCERIRTVLT